MGAFSVGYVVLRHPIIHDIRCKGGSLEDQIEPGTAPGTIPACCVVVKGLTALRWGWYFDGMGDTYDSTANLKSKPTTAEGLSGLLRTGWTPVERIFGSVPMMFYISPDGGVELRLQDALLTNRETLEKRVSADREEKLDKRRTARNAKVMAECAKLDADPVIKSGQPSIRLDDEFLTRSEMMDQMCITSAQLMVRFITHYGLRRIKFGCGYRYSRADFVAAYQKEIRLPGWLPRLKSYDRSAMLSIEDVMRMIGKSSPVVHTLFAHGRLAHLQRIGMCGRASLYSAPEVMAALRTTKYLRKGKK